jgi:hypothetical protein
VLQIFLPSKYDEFVGFSPLKTLVQIETICPRSKFDKISPIERTSTHTQN